MAKFPGILGLILEPLQSKPAAKPAEPPKPYPAQRTHASETCDCTACARERQLIALVESGPADDVPPRGQVTAPDFRDMAALEHATKPITEQDVSDARARMRNVQDALAAGRVKMEHVAPGKLDVFDINIVSNFVAAATRVLTEQLTDGKYDLSNPEERNEVYLRIAALTDFERFYVVPAARAIAGPPSTAELLEALFGPIMGDPRASTKINTGGEVPF